MFLPAHFFPPVRLCLYLSGSIFLSASKTATALSVLSHNFHPYLWCRAQKSSGRYTSLDDRLITISYFHPLLFHVALFLSFQNCVAYHREYIGVAWLPNFPDRKLSSIMHHDSMFFAHCGIVEVMEHAILGRTFERIQQVTCVVPVGDIGMNVSIKKLTMNLPPRIYCELDHTCP